MYLLKFDRIFSIFLDKFAITTYPRKGTTKHLRYWHLPAAEVLCFILVLFTGYRAGVVPAEMVIVTGSALTP